MDFQNSLVFVRARLNLSQKNLAERLGVSYPTIYRWEQGRVKPTRKAIMRFEQFCRENDICFPEDIINKKATESESEHEK